jgi:hypothetical protein
VNEDGLSIRPPVRIEILSSAENILLLDKGLHEILEDAPNSCDFTCDVDRNGETVVKINCVVDEDEKESVWDLMRFKHKRDRHIIRTQRAIRCRGPKLNSYPYS